MKKLRSLWLFLAVLFIGGACSNEFDLVDEWKDIPIVYGLLSPKDQAHYIRVEKAFLDPTTSALTVAQNPDSLYYPNASVQLEHVETGDVFFLEKVDGNLEGLERQDGVFASAPNYLYKFTLDNNEELIGGDVYRLMINRGDNKPLVTAEATMLSDFNLVRPSLPGPLEWADYNLPQKIIWRVTEDAFIFDVKILIHIQEANPDDPTEFLPRTLEWVIDKNVRAEEQPGQLKIEVPGRDLYAFIASALADGPNVRRFFVSYDYELEAGGKELLDFIDLGNANTGITSSQVIPNYTNLSEGRGLFTSRNSFKLEGFTLKPMSLDSLRFGEFTKDLNFQ